MHGANNWKLALGVEDNEEFEDNYQNVEEGQGEEEDTSLEAFVENYVHLEEEDHSAEAAFNLIQPIVAENSTKGCDEAGEIVLGLEDAVLFKLVAMLSDRVQERKRKVPTTKKAKQKEIEKWLQFSNAQRNFLFYSTAALKDMILKQNIKMKGSKTIDRMIKALAEVSTGEANQATMQAAAIANLPTEMAIVRAILMRSFLPHLKLDKREDCVTGHILERPILEKWISKIPKRGFPVRSLNWRCLQCWSCCRTR